MQSQEVLNHMAYQLSQKEKMLLQDQQKHEEVCIAKYKLYAQQAQEPQLKQLFSSYAQQEQQHYNTLGQILQGQTPSTQGQQQQQQQKAPGEDLRGSNNAHDAGLCNDMLMTEKYISGTYNTAIFECQENSVRQALNHIQKEEQEHGEGIFNYMKNSGMYQPQ